MPTTRELRQSYPELVITTAGPVCDYRAAVLVVFLAGPPDYPAGRVNLRVHPAARQAFRALAAVFHHHGYSFDERAGGTLSCRYIGGTTSTSLHAHGIAEDINPSRNGYRRVVGPIQWDRYTDLTPELVADVEAIRTAGGRRVFEWGGRWWNTKDPMHFELDALQLHLRAEGIDLATVAGWEAYREFESDISPPPNPEDQVLGPNSPRPSNAVADYQAALIELGYDLGAFEPLRPELPPGADGFWGDQTEAATRDWQERQDLDPTGLGDALTVVTVYAGPMEDLVTRAELVAEIAVAIDEHGTSASAHDHDHAQRGPTSGPRPRD